MCGRSPRDIFKVPNHLFDKRDTAVSVRNHTWTIQWFISRSDQNHHGQHINYYNFVILQISQHINESSWYIMRARPSSYITAKAVLGWAASTTNGNNQCLDADWSCSKGFLISPHEFKKSSRDPDVPLNYWFVSNLAFLSKNLYNLTLFMNHTRPYIGRCSPQKQL